MRFTIIKSGIVLLVAVTAARAEIIDVFFLAGQSNASGRVSTGYVSDPRDSEVRYFYRTDGPAASDVTSNGKFTTLAPLATGYYGPEIAIGRGLVDLGFNAAIIKVSDGGTSLANNWNSTAGGNWWNAWKTNAKTALTELVNAGHTVRIQGFFWLQGETDATNATSAANYQTNFQNLTGNVSTYLSGLGYDTTRMGFVAGMIRTSSGDYSTQVRTAQKNVMTAHSKGAYFDTDDLGMLDALHYNAAGINTIGERFVSGFSAVPEPSSSALLMGAGCGAFLIRRRSKRLNKIHS